MRVITKAKTSEHPTVVCDVAASREIRNVELWSLFVFPPSANCLVVVNCSFDIDIWTEGSRPRPVFSFTEGP